MILSDIRDRLIRGCTLSGYRVLAAVGAAVVSQGRKPLGHGRPYRG
jgi:hypothetical protein